MLDVLREWVVLGGRRLRLEIKLGGREMSLRWLLLAGLVREKSSMGVALDTAEMMITISMAMRGMVWYLLKDIVADGQVAAWANFDAWKLPLHRRFNIGNLHLLLETGNGSEIERR